MPKFSILTPFHNHSRLRKDGFLRSVHSMAGQTFKDFEHICVNDGSPVVLEEKDWLLSQYKWLKIIEKDGRLERLNAYHDAFEVATGEYICFLDSDDQFSPYYLEQVDKMISNNPDYKLFNFGCLYIHKDGRISTRDAFKLAKLDVGHEVFGKGRIVNGTFVFYRSIYEELGGFPHGEVTPENQDELEKLYGRKGSLSMTSPWYFSCWFQLKYPEVRPYCMVEVDERGTKVVQELGNPFGQDYALYYMLTRKYHSLPFDIYLYIVYPK